MRSKFTQILVLTAWLLAMGAHWDLVQAFAWSRMLVNNARVLPLGDALELTFSPEGRCKLCQAVQDNRPAAGEQAALVNLLGKEPLVFQTLTAVVVVPPAAASWTTGNELQWTHERTAPPTPPPRVAA